MLVLIRVRERRRADEISEHVSGDGSPSAPRRHAGPVYPEATTRPAAPSVPRDPPPGRSPRRSGHTPGSDRPAALARAWSSSSGQSAAGKSTWAAVPTSRRTRSCRAIACGAVVGAGEDDIAASADAFALLERDRRAPAGRPRADHRRSTPSGSTPRTASPVARPGPYPCDDLHRGRVRHSGGGVPRPQPCPGPIPCRRPGAHRTVARLAGRSAMRSPRRGLRRQVLRSRSRCAWSHPRSLTAATKRRLRQREQPDRAAVRAAPLRVPRRRGHAGAAPARDRLRRGGRRASTRST